jgi:hypothetical protein
MSTNQGDYFRRLSKEHLDRQKAELDERMEKIQAGADRQRQAYVEKGIPREHGSPTTFVPPPPMFTRKELAAIHQALSFADGESCLYEPDPRGSRGQEVKFCRELIEKAAKLAGV